MVASIVFIPVVWGPAFFGAFFGGTVVFSCFSSGAIVYGMESSPNNALIPSCEKDLKKLKEEEEKLLRLLAFKEAVSIPDWENEIENIQSIEEKEQLFEKWKQRAGPNPFCLPSEIRAKIQAFSE